MKLKNIIKELHLDPEKVTKLKAKYLKANQQINEFMALQQEAQILLDKAARQVQQKIKIFQSLDTILAEFKLSVDQKEALKKEALKKAAKTKTTKTAKTAEQTMADIMECLDSLPAEKRDQVLIIMQDQQNQQEI